MHQLDRIEQMLETLTQNKPETNSIDVHQKLINAGSKAFVIEMFASMKDGKKIEAIRAYRMLTGEGLKESKDAIEAIYNMKRND